MTVQETIIGYLRRVNPTAIERMPLTEPIKLRRILDSLDMVDFLAYLEKTYDIRIQDQDVLSRNFETVGSVIAFIRTRIEEG